MKYKNMLFAITIALSSINANATELQSEVLSNEAAVADWVHSIIVRYATRPRPIRH